MGLHLRCRRLQSSETAKAARITIIDLAPQTIANVHQALDHKLKIVPVVNKIDLPQANPELVREEIEKVIGLPAESVIFASARQGIGTKEILEAVVREVPPPTGDREAPLRALIFDAKFDAYRGVVTYVRVLEGTLRKGVRILMMQTGKSFEVDDALLQEFRKSLDEANIAYTQADLIDNNDWIKSNIKSEIFVDAFGQDEGMKVRAQSDLAVQKALEFLPEAKQLAENARRLSAQKSKPQVTTP